MPEVTTLAKTIETWWPQILAFLQTGITNAGTEANNQPLKFEEPAKASSLAPIRRLQG